MKSQTISITSALTSPDPAPAAGPTGIHAIDEEQMVLGPPGRCSCDNVTVTSHVLLLVVLNNAVVTGWMVRQKCVRFEA